MCKPYLDDLRSRVLGINESIRSARLECREVADIGRQEEYREPIVFTVDQLTSQVVKLMQDVDRVGSTSALWNSKTPDEVILVFQQTADELSAQMLDVVAEASALRRESSAIGIKEEDLAPCPGFDSLLRMVESKEQRLDSKQLLEGVKRAISDVETNSTVRSAVLSRVESILAKIPKG